MSIETQRENIMSTDLKVQRPNPAVEIADRSHRALDHLRPEMTALDDKSVIQVNVDPTLAINRSLGVLPAVAANREAIRRLPVDQHAIDDLEERAYAFSYASVLYESAVTPPSDFADIVEEVFDARGVLLAVGKGLVSCNLLTAEQLVHVEGGHGYKEAAADALLLTSVFRGEFPNLEGKVPVTLAQLDRVEAAANRLQVLLALREQIDGKAAAADLRARSFTLLDRAYSEVRRALSFIRWYEDDADTIAPSLRARSPRKPADKSDDKADDKNTQPATDAAPVKRNDVAPVKVEIASMPVMPAAPAPSGLPRSDPYGRG